MDWGIMKDKKVHKKLHLGWLYFIVLAFFVGFFYTLMIYTGFWGKMVNGISTQPFWSYPLWILFSFYLTLTLHELGHLCAFVLKGIKIKALYITIFIFYKKDQKWHITINPKLWVLFGGLVVPDLGEIKDEESYHKISNAFTVSLITAPLVTIIFLGLSILSTFMLILWSSSLVLIGIFLLNTLIIILLSTLYIYSFRLSNPMFYGDFVAYKKMKTDKLFELVQVHQYMMFSSIDSKQTEIFLFDKMRAMLETIKINSSLFHTMLVSSYLDGIIYHQMKSSEIVHEKISKLLIKPYTKTEQGLMLAYELAYYHYLKEDVGKAYQIFEQIQNYTNSKLDQKLLDYMKYKSMHIMHMGDYEEYLNNPDHYYLGMSWMFDRLIDPLESIKEQHQKFKYVEYSCKVDLTPPIEETKSDIDQNQ